MVFVRLVLLCACSVPAALADPEADVRAAVQAWRDASGYAWEATARVTESQSLAPDARKAPARTPRPIARGKSESGGLTEIVLLPKARNDPPVTAYVKSTTSAVAGTPVGWLTRQEMRDAPEKHRDRSVTIDEKPVRLYRLLSLGIDATNVPIPIEEILTLLTDVDAFEELRPGEIAGGLKPMAAEMLLGANRIRRADTEMKGRVIFRLRQGLPAEYEVRFETVVPPSATRHGTRHVTWWKTTLSGIGTTRVRAPREAVGKLEP